MKRKWPTATAAGILLLTLTACGAGTTGNSGIMAGENNTDMEAVDAMTAAAEQKNQGELAPDFEMTDLDGGTVKRSDFAGEKVYLKYWASWCPICLGGLEDVNTLSAEDSGFRVLTIVAPGQNGEKREEDFKTWFAGRRAYGKHYGFV